MRLHAIGFPCEMDRATAAFIVGRAALTRRRIATDVGEYRVWRSTSGAEIWLHYRKASRPAPGGASAAPSKEAAPAIDPLDDLVGMSVVHDGLSDVRLRLVRTLALPPAGSPLEGVALAELGSHRRGDRPVVLAFELLGFASERLSRPCAARVRLTGLAQRIWAFKDEAAYLAGLPGTRLMGLGSVTDTTPRAIPDVPLVYRPVAGALWLVSGTIRRSLRLVNPVTAKPYYWIALDTDRGALDIVANPDRIEGDISDGHVLQAVVTVTGRILERLG